MKRDLSFLFACAFVCSHCLVMHSRNSFHQRQVAKCHSETRCQSMIVFFYVIMLSNEAQVSRRGSGDASNCCGI